MAISWDSKYGIELRRSMVRAFAEELAKPWGPKEAQEAQDNQDRRQLAGMWFDYLERPERQRGWVGHRLWRAHVVRRTMDQLAAQDKPCTVEAISKAAKMTSKNVTVALAKLKALGVVESGWAPRGRKHGRLR